MNRLTERIANTKNAVMDINIEDNSVKKMINKLAEYEDTGLEPSEVVTLKAVYKDLYDEFFEQNSNLGKALTSELKKDKRIAVLERALKLASGICVFDEDDKLYEKLNRKHKGIISEIDYYDYFIKQAEKELNGNEKKND